MIEPTFEIGMTLFIILLVAAGLGSWLLKFRLLTVPASVSLVSLSFILIPHLSYSWDEWVIKNLLFWILFILIYIAKLAYDKSKKKN